jgi:hypothetical protein
VGGESSIFKEEKWCQVLVVIESLKICTIFSMQ